MKTRYRLGPCIRDAALTLIGVFANGTILHAEIADIKAYRYPHNRAFYSYDTIEDIRSGTYRDALLELRKRLESLDLDGRSVSIVASEMPMWEPKKQERSAIGTEASSTEELQICASDNSIYEIYADAPFNRSATIHLSWDSGRLLARALGVAADKGDPSSIHDRQSLFTIKHTQGEILGHYLDRLQSSNRMDLGLKRRMDQLMVMTRAYTTTDAWASFDSQMNSLVSNYIPVITSEIVYATLNCLDAHDPLDR
ncbi:MAG: hypothetical protein AAF919_13220 [Pseudomonadota bacterium]